MKIVESDRAESVVQLTATVEQLEHERNAWSAKLAKQRDPLNGAEYPDRSSLIGTWIDHADAQMRAGV